MRDRRRCGMHMGNYGGEIVAFRFQLPRRYVPLAPVRLTTCNRRRGHDGACHADAFGMRVLNSGAVAGSKRLSRAA